MRKTFLSLIILFCLILTGCNTYEQSETGFLYGNGKPSKRIGENYSHYYDLESRYVYEKNNGKWINKYAIGGEALYNDNYFEPKMMKRTQGQGNKKTRELIDMLSNSFYSTNISASFCWVDENDNMPESTYDLQMKVFQNYAQIFSNDNPHYRDYFKYTEEGFEKYEVYDGVKLHAGNTMSIKAEENIASIYFIFSGFDDRDQISCDSGELDYVTWGPKEDDSPTNEVTLTVEGEAADIVIQYMFIDFYDESSSESNIIGFLDQGFSNGDEISELVDSSQKINVSFNKGTSSLSPAYFEDGQYNKIPSDENEMLSVIPFPTFDSIMYRNFGIYQEDLGQMTAIVAANMNKAYFDESDGFYKIDKIKIKHGELEDSLAGEGKITFSFCFKPSIDNEYVETAYFYIVEDYDGSAATEKFKINFYDYHNTKINLIDRLIK